MLARLDGRRTEQIAASVHCQHTSVPLNVAPLCRFPAKLSRVVWCCLVLARLLALVVEGAVACCPPPAVVHCCLFSMFVWFPRATFVPRPRNVGNDYYPSPETVNEHVKTNTSGQS